MVDTTADDGSTIFTRRGVLAAGAATLAGGLAGGIGWGPPAQAAPSTSAAPSAAAPRLSSTGAQLVILGTAAGPPPQAGHAGIATVLRVDGRNYVVDCGRAAVTQYEAAGLRFADLRSIFITHLHADHLADYYNFFMLGGWGPGPQDRDPGITTPIPVYGPGPAGALPPPFGGGPITTVSPEDPTPGLATLTRRCIEAYAYSTNVFMRDSASPDVTTLIETHEIAVPDVGADPLADTAPPMDPFPVMADDLVEVTAILVPHGPVFPSFAFRFDTEFGSVVFSGDTSSTDNIVTLARGADVLVHEAIDLDYFASLGTPPAQLSHLTTSHTLATDAGLRAQQAGVRTLVLSHLAPGWAGAVPDGRWVSRAKSTFSGNVVRARELQVLSLR